MGIMQQPRSIVLFVSFVIAHTSWGQTYFTTGGAPDGGRLYKAIDLCEPQLLAVTPGFDYLDITLLADRRLLGYRFANPAGFYEIDTITGAANLLVENPYTASAIETESDSTILFAVGGQSQLFRLHLVDLSMSIVGSIGFQPDGDLLLLGDTLFLTTVDPNALLRIELSPDHQTITSVLNIGQLFLSNVWGLALPTGFQVVYPGCILATAGQELYAINTNTLEVTQICAASVAGSFTGAASFNSGLTWNPSTHLSESRSCSWIPQPNNLYIGEEGMDAILSGWLPSSHTLLQWTLFDAAGRYVAGERGPTIGALQHLSHGLYILRCTVQDPCGRKINVPTIRLYR